MSLLRPCATSAGFMATRDPPWHLDMARLKRDLVGDGFTLVIDAKVVLIVRKAMPGGQAVESSLYDNGKILLKTTDKPAAEAAFAQIERHVAAARKA